MTNIPAAGSLRLGDGHVNRMAYGAVRLSGPAACGPPKDRDQALARSPNILLIPGTSS